MGGACSRRMYPRQNSTGSSEGDEVHSGRVIREGGLVANTREHQHGEHLQPAFSFRDGFVGQLHSSTSRSFRVWSSTRGLAPEGNAEGLGGSYWAGHGTGGGSVGTLDCHSISGRSSGRTSTDSSASSSPSSAAAAAAGFAANEQLSCSLHGVLCPVLPQRNTNLQEMCLSLLCCQLKELPGHTTQHLLSLLSKDLTQRVFDKWVHARLLTLPLLRSLSSASLEEAHLQAYPGVTDKWLLALRQQTETLLSVDLSQCHAVTDIGLLQLLHANSIRSFRIDMCRDVTDDALLVLQDCSSLRTLSCKGCRNLTAHSLSNLSTISTLTSLDLSQCPNMNGVLRHITQCVNLKYLNLACCNLIDDSDAQLLTSFPALEELHLSRTHVTDAGVIPLACLSYLKKLSLEGCHITDACFGAIGKMSMLQELDLGSCGDVTDAALVHIRLLPHLQVLNLSYTAVGNGHASMFSELKQLEKLSLDSCAVSDASVEHLAEIKGLRSLDLSDTVVTNEGMVYIGRMKALEELNLSFSSVSDVGMRALSSLPRLRCLNIDSRTITDRALAYISTLTGLRSLDIFGAKITDAGLAHLKNLKQLESLEVCSGNISDAGILSLSHLTSLTSLNLSQNQRILDSGLSSLAPLTQLHSLNLSGCRVSSSGLVHLRSLPRLHSLALYGCKVSMCAVKKTILSPECQWPKDVMVAGVK